MQVKDYKLLWQASNRTIAAHGMFGPLRRARFMADAFRLQADLHPLLQAAPGSLLNRTVNKRPEVLGFIVAPYICNSWDAPTRLRLFANHVDTADRLGSLFNYDIDHQIDVMPLNDLADDLWIVIDKPVWFFREGTETINLFLNGTRIFTIAFSLQSEKNGVIAIIGGVQGRNFANSLDIYRDLTKASAGLRPRDLLFEVFRILCRQFEIERILAVTDAGRHHRSPYFGQNKVKMTLNYDEVWSDRGGKKIDHDFFELSSDRSFRDESDIPAKKRSLYRRRYDILDRLEEKLITAFNCSTAGLIRRKD